jgi:hypothetical protein
MLLISKTYEVITEESAEHGEVEESGFEFEFESFSFRDLVRQLRFFPHPSSSVIGPDTWVSSEPEQDYRTGEYRTEHLHFVGPERKEKYWIKALKLALK